ncbi:MAG TPA: hypothetical protein VMY36_04630 [Patescibacteria group bacterium]|nr:hypothetical protein [Patescibacteria group bacterium]
MKKFLTAFVLTSFALLVLVSGVKAAKTRPPRGSATGTPVARTYTRGIYSTVRFRPDRLGLLINFSGFSGITTVTYTLTYEANGIPQGAMGTATPETGSEQRELLFGTCSHGTCRYHTNITNARLVIDSKLTSGLIIRKPYRINI